MVTAKDNGIQRYEPRIEAENVLAMLTEMVSKTSNEASGKSNRLVEKTWQSTEIT